MGNFLIPQGINLDRKIFRFLSFHEFIDTLKFSQVLFSPLNSSANTDLTVARQSWVLMSKEEVHDWRDTIEAQPQVCIVSSIRALAESLFTDDATSIRIEYPDQSVADGTVELITYSKRARHSPPADKAGLRVLVDLGRMLSGIVVSAEASERFLSLVARIVQENTVVNVTRAIPSVRMAVS